MTIETIHRNLASRILKNGISFPKKHGEWVCLRFDDNTFLSLDTHNLSIKLQRGNGEYEYWTGFKGNIIKYFGCCWGRFEAKTTKEEYYAMFTKINNGNL